jgi:hypothetical protein
MHTMSQASFDSRPSLAQRVFFIDDRSLEFFRVMLGLILVGDALSRLTSFDAHYGSTGVLPASVAISQAQITGSWTGFFIHDSRVWSGAVLAGLFAAGTLLLWGRVRGLALALGWASSCLIQARNPGVSSGADTLLRLLLFWATLATAARSGRSREDTFSPRFMETLEVFPRAGLMVQVAVVYWLSSIYKSDPTWRTEASAVWYTLSHESLQGLLAPMAMQHPTVLAYFTRATLFLQELGPLAAFLTFRNQVWRLVIVVSFWAFHLFGIGLTMRLGSFSWVAACAWIVFLPPMFWDSLFPSFGRWMASRLELRESPWSKKSGCGSAYRATTSRITTFFVLCNGALAATALLGVILWNLAGLKLKLPAWVPLHTQALTLFLDLDQRWKLFAPRPATRDGYISCMLSFDDGTTRTFIPSGLEWHEAPPQSLRYFYESVRWHKFLHGLVFKRHPRAIQGYADYVLREAESRDGVRPATLRIDFYLKDTFYPEDGVSLVTVYPWERIDSNGLAVFRGDWRQNGEKHATDGAGR